ncbi:hypothetical protein EYF80_011932 [Liparis tanakae]|uniref:Uncharacterized protein n=1 Tax=Liparis tanakae TaxID=230148 RepID=A0A4Z2IJA8_9TELE|nr:hypothetical protein EYF80_011932 [Liparis tanakae]
MTRGAAVRSRTESRSSVGSAQDGELQAVLLVQLLQLLRLVFDEQVALLVLKGTQRGVRNRLLHAGSRSSEGRSLYLQLLQLPDVGVALQLQVPHLVLVFLELMEPLVLLPLLFLSCELENRDTVSPPGSRTLKERFGLRLSIR